MSRHLRSEEEEFPLDTQLNPAHMNNSQHHSFRANSSSHPQHPNFFDGDRGSRASRNSTGAKEEHLLGTRSFDLRAEEELPTTVTEEAKDSKALAVAFVGMVFVGLGNKVFNKLMTIPMYNYPNFLNLLTSFVYIPVCFAYIIPMAKYGYIPEEQFKVPKKTFAIMGALDALAGIMQIFGATYLPGPLIILLLQAAIPVSMVISRYLLSAQYNKFQYAGALIVAGGIMIVLAPSLTGGGSIVWALVLILSTVPMALSSVYKEIALGETELDAIYLNGWVAVFQFAFSLVLAIPSAYASEPPVPISELPANLYNGLECYFGKPFSISYDLIESFILCFVR
jgi:drug/metabolite transporter (DMT)-like permease